jgi:hypothetical protein
MSKRTRRKKTKQGGGVKGRPRPVSKGERAAFMVRLEPVIAELLNDLAARNRMSRNELITRIVEQIIDLEYSWMNHEANGWKCRPPLALSHVLGRFGIAEHEYHHRSGNLGPPDHMSPDEYVEWCFDSVERYNRPEKDDEPYGGSQHG